MPAILKSFFFFGFCNTESLLNFSCTLSKASAPARCAALISSVWCVEAAGFTEEPRSLRTLRGEGGEAEITAGLFIEDHSILSFLACSLVLTSPWRVILSVSHQDHGHFPHFGKGPVCLSVNQIWEPQPFHHYQIIVRWCLHATELLPIWQVWGNKQPFVGIWGFSAQDMSFLHFLPPVPSISSLPLASTCEIRHPSVPVKK